jgi:ankyrin repeat protein
MERKCMHNLDQSICDGTLESSLKLVATLHSNSTGNSVNPIVFNQWADGLRLATKSPALHLAILFGDDALVEPLIKNGFSPTVAYQLSDEPGMRDYLTPLDFAIASRNEPIIHSLLSNGAVLAPLGSDSPCRHLLAHTSLQLWPPSGLPEVLCLLELLLSCGWPVSKGFSRQNKPSATPTFLHQACALSIRLHDYRLPLVKLLIEGSDTTTLLAFATETPLHHAICRDDAEVVDSLLQAQASFRLRGLLDKKNSHDCQPIYIAVQRAIADHDLPLDIIRSLLHRGANLDEPHTLTETRLLRLSKKTRSTARGIAMSSGRQDLIALVQSVGDKQIARPLTRAHTVSGGLLMDRMALPRIGVP